MSTPHRIRRRIDFINQHLLRRQTSQVLKTSEVSRDFPRNQREFDNIED
jgi:hypothetical protein